MIRPRHLLDGAGRVDGPARWPHADVVANGRGDPSTITDFNGFIGLGDFAGGTGKDPSNTTLYWAADIRFMDGEYIGIDGRLRQGSFAFI
jgi:hypothetical protein